MSSIKCNRCGKDILPLASFCTYCGAQAPRLTVSVLDVKPPKDPIYCPHCKSEASKDSFFCPNCGKSFFELPAADSVYCPKCGTKNIKSAEYCSKCGVSLKDWFNMQGEIADKLGIKDNIVLFEKMNGTYYHFYNTKSLYIGSGNDVDIKIYCPWVSGKHAFVDAESLSIIDLQSSNGTYVNRSPERIKKLQLDSISEFNIAGSFTFLVKKFVNAVSFSLTAVLDENACKKIGNISEIDRLRKHYYILFSGDADIFIAKSSGELTVSNSVSEPCFKISLINNYFYFNDNLSSKLKLITENNWLISPNFKILEEH